MPEGAEKDGAENTRMKIFQICRGKKKGQPSVPKRSMNLKQDKYKENHVEVRMMPTTTTRKNMPTF